MLAFSTKRIPNVRPWPNILMSSNGMQCTVFNVYRGVSKRWDIHGSQTPSPPVSQREIFDNPLYILMLKHIPPIVNFWLQP